MKNIKSLASLLLLVPHLGWCLETVSVQNHEKQELQLSNTDYNRLFVKDDRIQSVKGMAGQYQLESDESLGDIYIKTNEENSFTLFITTEKKKTLQLLIQPVEDEAKTIELVIDEPEIKIPNNPITDWMSFSLALEQGKLIPGSRIEEITTSYKLLHNGLHAKITRLIQKHPWQGEFYTLKNFGKKTLTLNNEDYYTPNTVSVSVSEHAIKPLQEITLIKVVKYE